jgi:hypothetical protein
VTILHNPAFHHGVPLGTICELIASHSGMFCSAMTIKTSVPRAEDAPCATPIAIPSAPECIVMITIMRKADFHHGFFCVCIQPVRLTSSCFSAQWCVRRINARPISIPPITLAALCCGFPVSCKPSYTS